MAKQVLQVGSAGVAVGDGATGVGIGVARGATGAGIGVARAANAVGLGAARLFVAAPAALLGVAGPNPVSRALWSADGAIARAHGASDAALAGASASADASLVGARSKAGEKMGETRGKLNATANSEGLYLRVVLGVDTAEVILAARGLIYDYAAPLGTVRKIDLFRAARAWGSMQRAALLQEGAQRGPQVILPQDSERWVRYTIAVFGAQTAGKMTSDKGSQARELEAARQGALADSVVARQEAHASFKSEKAQTRIDAKARQADLKSGFDCEAKSSGDGGDEGVAPPSPCEAALDDAEENDSADSKELAIPPVESPEGASSAPTQREEKQALKRARAAEQKEMKEARAQEKAVLAQEAKELKLARAQAAQELKLAKAQAARELKLARAQEKQDKKDGLVQNTSPAEPEEDDSGDEESDELVESACLEAQIEKSRTRGADVSRSSYNLTRREQKAALNLARAQEKEESKSVRAQEEAMLKASRAQTKGALSAIRSEEKATLRAAQERKSLAVKAAKAQGQEALALAEAHWRSAAGRGGFALACAGIEAQGVDVVLFNEETEPPPGQPAVPGQMVAVDQVKGCVVVALRGSSCLRDALVDLDCAPETLNMGGRDGLAHGGMLRSAQLLIHPLAEAVDTALESLVGPPRILVTGHSLGAGIAALVTALWMDAERFPLAEVKCLAYACPQVLDATFSLSTSTHTTSYVYGEDTVPCLGLASAKDLRDALVMIADPEARVRIAATSGFEDLEGLGADEILAAAHRGDVDTLTALYTSVRRLVGSHEGRLFPSGRLVKILTGSEVWEANFSEVDEMIVTMDMVAAHMPHRYLAAVQEVATAGGATACLWREQSAL